MKKFIDEKTKQVIWIYQEMISMNYYLHNEYIHCKRQIGPILKDPI